MAKQSIDPALLALQTAKKTMPASPSTQAVSRPSLNVPKQQPQAISTNITPPVAKIGGISSPFGAANINSGPVMGGATPQEIGTRAKELQSLPKAMPATGSEPVKKLSIDDFANKIKEKYPEYKDKDNKTLTEAMIKKYPEYKDKVAMNTPTTTQNIAGGAVATIYNSGLAEPGKRISKFLGENVTKPLVGLLPDGGLKTKLLSNIESNIEGMQDPVGTLAPTADPESTAFKTTKLIGDIGQTALLPGVPGVTKGAGFLKGAGQLALQGLGETVKYSAIADQRLPTKEELAYGVGGNVLLGGAIAGAPKAIEAIKGFKPIESIARKITGTSDDYGKLFKSAEPRTNQLNKAVDYKNLQKNHNIASEEIVKAGYKPVDTASRAEAHANTMKKIRKEEIESKIGNNFRINLNPVADKIDEFVAKQKTAGLLKNEGQLAELKAQADKFRKMGEVDGADGEFIKEMLNSQINNRGDASLGDVYKNGLKEATKTLGQSLDDTFSAIPGQFAEAKKRFGALKATYQDVVKADIKAQKAKGLGLGETFGRIEGIGDILGAVGGLVTGKNPLPQLASGFGKLAVGKVLSKIKDKDFLIQEGFEGLSKKIPVANPINISKKGTQLGLPLLKQTTKAPTVITPSGIIQQTPITPKPTPKTPPITVEKGAIGMGTPKVNNTPVIPPKATVAPSVSAPKVDTFARMTELDSNPLYKKISFQETNYGRNAKGLETEFGTIQKVNVDNRYNPQSYTIDDVQYPTSQINNFREKQAPEVVAQANKVSKAISDLKAIESGKGKIMGSNLRSVLDDLGIKDVNSIPEGTEEDILQMVRARKPVPSKGMPKLGKETLEQNITQGDDLIQEAKKYKSAEDMINSLEKEGKITYHGTNVDFDSFDTNKLGLSTKADSAKKAIFFTDDKDIARGYGEFANDRKITDIYSKVDQLQRKGKRDEASMLEAEAERLASQPYKEPVIKKVVIDSNKIYKYDAEGKGFLETDKKINDIIDEAKSKGYDVVEVKNLVDNVYADSSRSSTHTIVLNPSVIKTEAQLKQIREQANKKSLPPLPKKGK